MNRKVLLTLLQIGLLMLLAACDDGGVDQAATDVADSTSAGDAVRGEELYNQTVIGSANAPGCVTCHSLEPGFVLNGPSHAGLAGRAGDYQAGVSAEAYLRKSITNPDAHLVGDFSEGLMYQYYGDDLTAREINDLVAYLQTLK